MENRKPKLFYGYVVVAAAVCIMMIAWGSNRTFGVFLEPMLNEFGWTRAGISGAFTLCMIIMGLFAIAAGRLTDRFGPRVVLIGCAFFLGLGYLLVSRVGAIWQLYLFYGVITGIGMSGAFAPLLSIVPRWFVKRRALMSGIVVAGPALGIVVMPLAFTLFISAYGWRTSYIILGSVVLVLIVLAALFLRRDPGQMGLMPYGADKGKAGGMDLQAAGLSLGEAVRTRQFWLLSVVSFSDLFLMNVITVHIVIYTIGLGIPATAAASVLSVAAGVSIPARVIIGGVADRIGNKPAFMICFITSVVAFLLLLVARELWILYLFAAIFGFGLWSSGAIMAPITAELFGLKSHGTILACTAFASAVGGAVGPVLVGYIFDVTGSYQLGFILCLLVTIVGITALIFLRPISKGEIARSN